MKRFLLCAAFALTCMFVCKKSSYALDILSHDYNNGTYRITSIESTDTSQHFCFIKHPTEMVYSGGVNYPVYYLYSDRNTPISFRVGTNPWKNIGISTRYTYVSNGFTYYCFYDSSIRYVPNPTDYDTPLINIYDTFSPSNFISISKSDVIDSFGGDGFDINGSLNGNTVDVFKCNPFRLLSTDYMYYEVSIKSLKQFSGSKAIVKLIGDRSTYSHTVTNPFLSSFDTIPVDDYVSVNSDFYMVCTPIDSNDNYGNSIVYKYRLTQDGIISVYDNPIDTPKGLNVDINNNYLPVTQINKNRAFVTNIDYSTVTYNSMNVEYSNSWDIYYSPNISTSNDNISIQNIADSYNTYNYVTNNYNDLTYGLGLNFDLGDNDISDDGNVIDTLDDIKVLLSFLPWLLGLFTFIPDGFVTIILGGFTILLVVVVVKIFK